jgi:hypothetical protein
MRCQSCNQKLTDFESTRKYVDGDYVDLCNTCFKASGYLGHTIDRKDLKKSYVEFKEDYEEDC